MTVHVVEEAVEIEVDLEAVVVMIDHVDVIDLIVRHILYQLRIYPLVVTGLN